MTYVDDDDFDEIQADLVEDELEEDDAGRCDECGIAVKKDDALVCPACTAMYHQWCVTECNPLQDFAEVRRGGGSHRREARQESGPEEARRPTDTESPLSGFASFI